MKDDFIMSPKVDFAFKEMMYNETVRKGFLSAVLNIRDTEIKSVVMLNTNLTKVHKDEKQGILDVRLTMNDNTEIDIEMQVCSMNNMGGTQCFLCFKDDCRADQHQ
ncbi:MAG: PD-(D/E)XK nuclease family transposase [Ruminococcus sp.]|nr:PD-(D/E)XK nuclease family transposase [Ruminococcus sp.]